MYTCGARGTSEFGSSVRTSAVMTDTRLSQKRAGLDVSWMSMPMTAPPKLGGPSSWHATCSAAVPRREQPGGAAAIGCSGLWSGAEKATQSCGVAAWA